AFHSDARAHRIYIFVAAFNGDFRTLASLARHGADLHSAIVNFRNFHFEEALHQRGVRARNNHLRSLGGALDRSNRYTEPVTNIVGLKARLFALWQSRFGAAEVHDHVRTFHPLHHTIDELAHPSVKFVIDRITLGFAHLLQDYLLGSLRGDSPEHVGRFCLSDFSADLDFGISLASVCERNLSNRIRDFFHHHVN